MHSFGIDVERPLPVYFIALHFFYQKDCCCQTLPGKWHYQPLSSYTLSSYSDLSINNGNGTYRAVAPQLKRLTDLLWEIL
jgi:hypothetical protein